MSPARAAPVDVEPRFAPVAAAFAGQRGVVLEPGWGKGNMVLKAGAKIFVLLAGAGLVAKLPKARVDELVAAGEGTRFDPRKNGRVMKEWLVAPAGATGWPWRARRTRSSWEARPGARSPERRDRSGALDL
jgi:hypothetical protein